MNILLCEQLLQVFDIVCKGKCPFHFSKGVPRALAFGIVATNSIPIVGFFQIISTKKKSKEKMKIQLGVPKCLGY